jgi:tRNA(fMet)-specific endonuclease VapC
MIVLDTDHLSEYQRGTSDVGARLRDRMVASADQEFVTTIITWEEQTRGRLARVRQEKTVFDEVSAYVHLAELIRFYSTWTILHFDHAAALQVDRLKKLKIRIGTMDLKIASIVLRWGAKLLSANLRDFRQVPGLLVEDWLRE